MDATYFCPDHPDQPSLRRKPAPGMLHEAAADHRLDLQNSWFVGDAASDIGCGKAAGTRTILVSTGYGQRDAASQPDHHASDVVAAVEVILKTCAPGET